MNRTEVGDNYDIVAENYARQFKDEMDKKPFDRKMLDWLIEKTGDALTICDLGCGPGQIAGYLKNRGAAVCGIDLSPKMVRQASILNAEITFRIGDMTNLENIADASFGGVSAFYSIVNIPPESLAEVFREIYRVLVEDGILLLAFHIGEEKIHLEEMLDKKVSLDFFFYETAKICAQLRAANFKMEEVIEREPYDEAVEHQSRRAYIFARK